jgi:hypothetical protein
VTVDFRYPVAAAAVAGAASVPGVNPRIPSEGDYAISVRTGANSCGNKLRTWCGAPANGIGVGTCGAVPLPAGVNTLPAGVRQAFRARWPLLRAFYRRAVVAGNTATWSTPFRNDATDTRAGAAPGGPFDP